MHPSYETNTAIRDVCKCEKCMCASGPYITGRGPDKARIVFVGDYPSIHEQFNNKAVSGPAAALMNKCLEYYEIDEAECYFTVAMSCGAPQKPKFKQADLANCRVRLIAEIKSREPEVVVLMGNTAIEAVMCTKLGVTSVIGTHIDSQELGCKVFYTYHPAAIMRAPKMFDDFSDSMKKLSKLLTQKVSTQTYQPTKKHVIENEDQAIKYCEFLMKQQLISCDIETTGFSFQRDQFLCIAFGWTTGKVVVLPRWLIISPLVRPYLIKLFECKTVKWLWQNGKFDCKFIRWQLKAMARVDEDTNLAHYCIDERQGTHDLETMSIKYLGASGYKTAFRNKLRFEDGLSFTDEQNEDLYQYCAEDVDNTFRLLPIFHKKMEEEDTRKVYDRLLIPATEVFIRCELHGLYTDKAYLLGLEKEFVADINAMRSLLDEIIYNAGWDPAAYAAVMGAKKVPTEFKLSSPKQLSYALIHLLGLPKYKGAYGTDKKAVKYWLNWTQFPSAKAYEDRPPEDYQQAMKDWTEESTVNKFLDVFQRYRKKTKIYSTYVKGVLNLLGPDSRTHPSFKLAGTETGRLACTEPNMQNPPRGPLIKNAFVAPPGKILLQADYSQAELRVLAVLSGDPTLRKVYFEDRDLHDEVSVQLYGPGFTKEQRVKTKAVNFGIPWTLTA